MEKGNTRNVSFQGLRGYACILVFISHCGFAQNQYGDNCFTWLGAWGVSIFIMLSGYLLISKYMYADLPSVKSMLGRKLKKVYPLHILTFMLAVPLVIESMIQNGIFKLLFTAITNLLLIHAWVPKGSVYFSFNAVSWYLCLVVFFALASGWVVKIQKRVKNIFIYLFALWFVEIVWYIVAGRIQSYSHWLIYILPIVRLVDFMIGAGIYALVRKNKTNIIGKTFITIAGSIVGLGLCALSLNTRNDIFSAVIWVMPSVMLIYGLSDDGEKSKLIKCIFENKLVVFIGNISFEMFLMHQLIIRYSKIILGDLNGWTYIIALIISIVASYVINICTQQINKKLKTKSNR